MNRQSEKITAIYTRIGGSGMAGGAMLFQQRELITFAKKQGMTNIRLYSDYGFNGHDLKRPAFRKLMKDIQSGTVAALVVHNTGRFWRGSLLSTLYMIDMFLPRYHVNLYAVHDPALADKKARLPYTAVLALAGGEH